MELGPIFRSLQRNRARSLLIALEVALTLAIVTNCLALIGKARAEMARQSGFDDENLISVRTRNFAPEFSEPSHRRDVLALDLATLRHLPGVRSVSDTTFLPWQGGGSSGQARIEGVESPLFRTQMYRADSAIAETLDMRLLAGRTLTEAEYLNRRPNDTVLNTLVSDAFARLVFPDGDALGKVLTDAPGTTTYRVVGILDEFYNPYGWPIDEYVMFLPGPTSFQGGSSFLVRTEPGRVPLVLREIDNALLAKNRGRTVQSRPIADIRASANMGNDVLVSVLTGLMMMLVLVTAIGIVGLTSFSVAERRRQIGTRRALGATKTAILRYFLVENWLVTTIGLTLGSGLALALNAVLARVADGARLDPSLLLGAVVVLWLFSLGATFGPALAATRVPPAIATRNI